MTSLLEAARAAGQPLSTLPVGKPHLFICTPCSSGKVDLNYHLSLTMAGDFLAKHGVDYTLDYNVGMSIDGARSQMATTFLRDMPQCTHLMFIDDDMAFAPDLLYRMLRENVDVIACAYRRKQTRIVPNIRHGVRVKTMPNRPHLISVESIATGMMMIRRNVFEKMAETTPEYRYDDTGKGGWLFFRHDLVDDEMVGGQAYMGEDYNFCRLVRQAGFEVWCYLDEELAHIGQYAYKMNYRDVAEKDSVDTFICPDEKLKMRILLQ